MRSIAFSHDGRLLATGHRDTTILLWDLDRVTSKLSETEQSAVWKRVSRSNAADAWVAMRFWINRPVDAVTFIREHVKPVPHVPQLDAGELNRLIATLEAPKFANREAAMARLIAAGESIVPIIRAARAKPASEESRKRLDTIWDRITAPEDLTPWLAHLRSIEVLERIGSPAAIEHLQALAAGGDAPPTRAAKQAIERLTAKVAARK